MLFAHIQYIQFTCRAAIYHSNKSSRDKALGIVMTIYYLIPDFVKEKNTYIIDTMYDLYIVNVQCYISHIIIHKTYMNILYSAFKQIHMFAHGNCVGV